MKNENQKGAIIKLVLLLSILVGAFIASWHFGQVKDECLEKNGERTVGTIVSTYIYKGDKVKASYFVGGKKHVMISGYNPSKKRVSAGEKYVILYCKSDPDLARIIFDERIY